MGFFLFLPFLRFSVSPILIREGSLPRQLSSGELRQVRNDFVTAAHRAYRAGFDGIELWVRDVEANIDQGGSAESIAEMLRSRNLVLENMIGFAPWFSEDAETRSNGLDQMRREMELTAKIGGKYIAAPIQGVKSLDR